MAAIEAHGTHLPLETDFLEVCEITRRAVEKVADEVKPVVAPPLPYGISEAFLGMLPYIATIIVLCIASKESLRKKFGAPAALGQPYVREI